MKLKRDDIGKRFKFATNFVCAGVEQNLYTQASTAEFQKR
jgi:hypothetical protein